MLPSREGQTAFSTKENRSKLLRFIAKWDSANIEEWISSTTIASLWPILARNGVDGQRLYRCGVSNDFSKLKGLSVVCQQRIRNELEALAIVKLKEEQARLE